MTATFWWVNTVQASQYLGDSGYVEQWADPITVSCWVEEAIDVSTDAQGTELTSTRTTVHGPLDSADLFAPGSKVTLPSGRVARVAALARFDSGSLALGVDHFEAALN